MGAISIYAATYDFDNASMFDFNEFSGKLRAFLTLIFYAPSISGQAFLIWKTLFSSDRYGWANAMLLKLDLITKEIAFFEDADYVMPLCIVVALWTSLGTSFLSFIAGFGFMVYGLKNIPDHRNCFPGTATMAVALPAPPTTSGGRRLC